MAVLEFVVNGTPVSVQSSSETKRFWQQRVAVAARQAAGEWVRSRADSIVLKVAYFYVYQPVADLDNIVKPLQDALKKIAYEDDIQVVDLIASMRPNTEGRRLKLTGLLPAVLSGDSDFVYVRVGRASRIEVFR
jgi:Holliday junction resolvase RusA-like endonuclease